MPWGVCVTHRATGKVLLLDKEEDEIDPDDPTYADDVHVVPMTEDGLHLSFGVHVFTRNCICHPQVNEGLARNMVIHSERCN